MSTFPACALGFVLFLGPAVNGFETGAPLSTCWTRYPKHSGLATQTSPSPFLISFSPLSYTPGSEITVTVESPDQRWFSGIEMGAFRATGNPEEIVGQFTQIPQDKLKMITCFGGYQNVVTHKNDLKVKTMQMKWTAPQVNVGNITFRATIVADYETFWIGVEGSLPSANQDLTAVSPPQYEMIATAPLVKSIDFSTCGDTKGCFLFPKHCNGDDCMAAASFQYRPDTDDYIFELHSNTAENYISLAFSDNQLMDKDETVSCISNYGMMGIQHGFNPEHHNERLLTRFISDSEVRQADGNIQCRFVLPKITTVYVINQAAQAFEYTNLTFDKERSWYLHLAWGYVMPESDVMSYHKDMPTVSDEKISLKEKKIFRGSVFPILVQVHGAVMMIAWIFLGGIVTVISRHYRDYMPRTRWCGTKVWFQIHRELAILMAILTAIGLITVLVHFDGKIREKSVPHSYVGLAVVAAVGVQIIAGFLRPGPNSKLRVYFNWGHRFLGQATHILAAVTMFLAYDIEFIAKDIKTFGFAVLGVWVAVQLMWHVVFEIISCRATPDSSYDLQDSGKAKTNTNSNTQTALMVVYVIVLAGLCIAALLAFLLH